MGKLNVGKKSSIKRTFDYQGDEVELSVKIDFTPQAYKEVSAKAKEAMESQDVYALAEMACFTVNGWNLEDDAGDIPLAAKEIYTRVPLMLLAAVIQEVQEVVASGGISKKPVG